MVLALASSSVGEPSDRKKGLADGNSATEVPAALSGATRARPKKPFDPMTATLTSLST
jgi:hypothetical protein